MNPTKPTFDDLFTSTTRAELARRVQRLGGALSLPQAQRLVAHAHTLEPAAQKVRIGIVHTYTSDLLNPWFALEGMLAGLDADIHHAPHGVTMQETQAGSGLLQHRPELTLLLLQPRDLHPDLAAATPLAALDADAQQQLRRQVLTRLTQLIEQFRAQPVGQLVLTLLPRLFAPALGSYDVQSESSEQAWWATLKVDIGGWLRQSVPAANFLDLDEVLQTIGRDQFFDRRYWYSAQFPFAPAAAREVARRVIAIGAVLKFPRAKVIALDADNTLWGGVIGEDGMDGIALGPDYPGNAYMDFQRRLLGLQQRGFILVLCSKNNAADVDEVLDRHPHQVLRQQHFAAKRVNWEPKPDNLAALAAELNLGLDSFVFVDDSDHECEAVRRQWPQIEVIQVPARAVDVPACLDRVARLEVLSLTAEDRAKTALYAQERKRREASASVPTGGDLSDYLVSLEMKMRIALNPIAQLTRLAQLTQKTNQFNLTTRRYDEQRMGAMLQADDWLVASFSLADAFGDSGVVGLALFRLAGDQRAELDTFLMSCRVIGRRAEAAFLQALLRHLEGLGVRQIAAEFLPTAKNGLAQEFLTEQGFSPLPDGRLGRDLRDNPPAAESAFPIRVVTE